MSIWRKPAKADDGKCYSCIKDGEKIEIWCKCASKRSPGWKAATVITKFTDTVNIRFNDGSLVNTNLNYYRWRPIKVNNLAHIIVSLGLNPEDEDDGCPHDLQRMFIHKLLLNAEPKSYNHIIKLPKAEQDKWDISMLKEWTSIKDKDVFWLN